MYSPRDKSSRSSERHDQDEDIHENQSSTTTYRSILSPRITNVQRSRPTGLNTPSVNTRVHYTHTSTGTTNHFGPGLASLIHNPAVPLRGGSNAVTTAIVSINSTRQREKHELENLNDKFAQYVEKVRYLEVHNRKLAAEIDALQTRLRQGPSRIKEMYDIEMNEATKLIDDTRRDAANSHAQRQRAEKDLRDQKERYHRIKDLRETDRREIDAIQSKIAENEAQIALFRRRITDLDDEIRRYKTEAQRLSTEITRLQNDVQNEIFLKTSCDVERIGVDDEITNLKQLHEVDLVELRSKSVTNDLDPSQFFRNELAEAIREIRNEYETNLANRRTDLQNRYSLIINEMTIRTQQNDPNPLYNEQQRRQVEHRRNELIQAQNQNNYLRNKNQEMKDAIIDLKQRIKFLKDNDIAAKMNAERNIEEAHRRLERAEQRYADITVYRTSLEKEIATYRELLESPHGLRGCADRIVQNVEQKAFERPATNSNYRFDTNRTTTRTVEHTYINTTGSNYSYLERDSSPFRRANMSSPPAAPSDSSTYHQVPSTVFRIIPVHDETARHSSSSDSTIRGDDYQQTNKQENRSLNNSNRPSLIRERTPSPPPPPPSSSSSSTTTSSTSSEEEDDQNQNLIHRNSASHRPLASSADYEVLTDV